MYSSIVALVYKMLIESSDMRKHHYVPNCSFCKIIMSNAVSLFNKTIFESDNFIVLPAMGHFTVGYLMLISKEHITNFAQVQSDTLRYELDDVIFRTRIYLEMYFGKCIIFEHGSIDDRNIAGNSITHAHLHFIPTNIKINSILENRFKLIKISNLSSINNKLNYLYIEDQLCNRFIINNLKFELESQYLRKLIYKYLYPNRIDNGWNWRIHQHKIILKKTMEVLNIMQEKRRKLVYLGLPMDGLDIKEIKEREDFFKKNLNSLPIEIFTTFNENDKLGNDFSKHEVVNSIVKKDLSLLRKADILLVDYSKKSHNYVGCTCEIVYAYFMNKPIIVFTGDTENHERIWLKYHANIICNSIEDISISISTFINRQ